MLVFDKRKSWLRLVFSWRGSELGRIRYRLLFIFALSVTLTYVQEVVHLKSPLTIPALSLMGMALGIFLGFRNNTSYDRFWEGRRLWGGLINSTRSLARGILTFSTDAAPSESSRRQIHRTIAFVHALRMQLRENMDVDALAPHLSAEDRAFVAGHKNVPNAVTLLMAREFAEQARRGELSDFRLIELSRQIDELTDIQGGCERIKNTPIPHSYSILIHRIVASYVFVLPFGLVQTLHLMTPIVVLLVAYTFLGLDAVGDELEDPFGDDLNDLPLDTLARVIEVNLLQTLGDEDVPPLLEPVDGLLT